VCVCLKKNIIYLETILKLLFYLKDAIYIYKHICKCLDLCHILRCTRDTRDGSHRFKRNF